MNELEAALLLGQWPGLVERFQSRSQKAAHLASRLSGLGGLAPQRLYPGTESGTFYIYAMPTQSSKSTRIATSFLGYRMDSNCGSPKPGLSVSVWLSRPVRVHRVAKPLM